MNPCCIAYNTEKGISFLTGIVGESTPPANDGVYKTDGSPPIGTFKWNKPKDSDGFMHITYAIALPQNGSLVDIPDSHDLLVGVNAAFTTIEFDCMLKFDRVPFTGADCADVTVKFDDGSDPIFVNNPGAMAYNHFPGTKPVGQFSSVYNLKYMWNTKDGPNFASDINQTFRHELRHAVGCVHTTAVTDLMYPFYHEQRRPSSMDTYQVQFMYGPRQPPVNPVEVDGFYNADSRNVEFSH